MFRSARWRTEKNKIKAEFKLQFHATQVSQIGVDFLTMTVIPEDVGKATVRLDKAPVRDGICRWESPVYETVKFVQDLKSGKINEKLYSFIISTGLTKSGVLGEVSINFADYAETTKPSSVSLPLHNSNSDAVLHVSIQRLQENVDQSEVEDCEDTEAVSLDKSLPANLSNGNINGSVKWKKREDEQSDKTSPVVEFNGQRTTSSGSDVTLSGSESSSGFDSPRDLGVRNNKFNHNPSTYLSSVGRSSVKSTYHENQSSKWELLIGSDHGASTDDSYDTLVRETSQKVSDIEIENLKSELLVLARRTDMSELELQTLRKQVVKERKKGQNLSREIVDLKEERDLFKVECEKFKAFRICKDDMKFGNKLQFSGMDLPTILEEMGQELNYEKDLNANLRLQLHKTQESNSELILAVQDLEEILEEKNAEIFNLSNKNSRSNDDVEETGINVSKCEAEEDEEQRALEELVKEHGNTNETYLLEQKVVDLSNEIDIYKRDKDELEAQIEQLALDYEILKQENHDMSYKLEQSQLQEQLKIQYECTPENELETRIENLERELKEQSRNFSDSLGTIKELEAHVKSLEEELEKQAQGYESDLEAVTLTKVQNEQRAIRAEEELRKTRLKNANTADKIQEEFKKLSMQMASTFDANEKVAMKAMAEASELRVQISRLEEMLKKAKEEIRLVTDDYEAKLCELSKQSDIKTSHIEQMVSELEEKKNQLEDRKKHEEEACKSFSQEILMLKSDITRLTTEKISLSEEDENLGFELEEMKKLVEENEMLIQKGNVEKVELLGKIKLLKKEAKKTKEELDRMKNIMHEKEIEFERLQSELQKCQAQCNKLNNSLFENEIQKEKLRKQVFQLNGEVKKKEEALNSIERKLKHSNGGTQPSPKGNKFTPISPGTKEVVNLRENMKSLEEQIKLKENALEISANLFSEKEKDLQNKIEELESKLEEQDHVATFQKENEPRKDHLDQLLTELESLKERNKSMESELKDMQKRYSEISLKFAEVEGERQQLVMTLRNLKNSKKI